MLELALFPVCDHHVLFHILHSFFRYRYQDTHSLFSLNPVETTLSTNQVKMSAKYIAALPVLASVVAGHGFVTSPTPRMPGDAMAAACGQQVYNNQKSDNYGNVQGELQVASSQSDYDAAKCDIWLCKGYKFDDNKDNVQTFKLGETVPFKVDVRAPHTGTANVSIIETSSNSIVGSVLKHWDEYASTATGVKSTDTSFDITIPEDLGGKCTTAGECVIQWWWDARSIDQTYESCVDFTVGGSSSGSSGSTASSSSAAVSSAASTPTTVAAAAVESSTLATSVVASATPATTPAATAASGGLAAELAAAFPSSVLTMELPTTPTATSGVVPDQSLPQGTTVQDLIDWFTYLAQNLVSGSNQKRHARDVAPAHR